MSIQEPGANESRRDREMTQIREALAGLRFGSLHVIVQDGVVIQIDRTEKRRLRNGGGTDIREPEKC